MGEAAGRWEALEASPYFWDWITLVCLAVAAIGFMLILIWLLGLPGRIAIARNHPDAEAVYAMGWAGFAAVVPWIQALIWAFKPTDKVDIRNFPEAERAAERADLEELGRYAYGKNWPRKRRLPDEKTRQDVTEPARAAPGTGASLLSEGAFPSEGQAAEEGPEPTSGSVDAERKD